MTHTYMTYRQPACPSRRIWGASWCTTFKSQRPRQASRQAGWLQRTLLALRPAGTRRQAYTAGQTPIILNNEEKTCRDFGSPMWASLLLAFGCCTGFLAVNEMRAGPTIQSKSDNATKFCTTFSNYSSAGFKSIEILNTEFVG
jgi:hypothetical protein